MGKRKRINPKYEKVVPGKDKGRIITGIEKIDDVIKGGFRHGEITIIPGIPNVGKNRLK